MPLEYTEREDNVNDLHYLAAAEKMGWHLLDFSVTEDQFAKEFVFMYYKPQMMKAIASYTSFKEWGGLMNVLKLDQKAVMAELDACLSQATELDYDMNIYDVAAYIDVNEYAYYLFERLVKYVDAFWFQYQLDEEEEYDPEDSFEV